MLDDLYGDKLPERIRETILVGDGKYEKPDHTNYWISSGKPLFSADASDMFYLPVGYEDPFLTTTHVEYDLPYFLAIKKAILAKDTPLETVTEVVGFDYRTLSPVKIDRKSVV